MKTGIRMTVYALLVMILFSCEHKELCFHHPHVVTVRVDFDWKNAPQANPEGMCVFFILKRVGPLSGSILQEKTEGR